MIGCDLNYPKLLICHVDCYIGSLNPYTGDIKYDYFKNFTEFVTKLLKDNPDYSPHNVTDPNIEEIIRSKIQQDKLLTNRIRDEIKR